MARLLTAAPVPDAVTVELRRWATEPFDWCALSVLSYVERVRRRRLRPRPRVAGRISAARTARSADRFGAIAADAMKRLGCAPTTAPQRGDVGLVDLPGTGLTAAICAGRLWAARGDHVVVFAAAVPVLAWRVRCHRR
ncbi:DUF6950 family protein [Sphingomonas sp. MS122]|uniref:DUF6950 family protein n=1 Tax=Sphingomonas sp. MS122 TaxID=3412683 RepID=UPI003C2EAF4C